MHDDREDIYSSTVWWVFIRTALCELYKVSAATAWRMTRCLCHGLCRYRCRCWGTRRWYQNDCAEIFTNRIYFYWVLSVEPSGSGFRLTWPPVWHLPIRVGPNEFLTEQTKQQQQQNTRRKIARRWMAHIYSRLVASDSVKFNCDEAFFAVVFFCGRRVVLMGQ